MKQKQTGFTVIEALLLVIALSIIGFGGYYVWNSNQQSNKSLSQAEQTSQKTSPIQKDQKYLTIKEWGVRFPYSGSDTYSYIYEPSIPTSIEVISQNLAKNYDCTSFGAGIIAKSLPSDNSAPSNDSPSVEEYVKQNPDVFFKVGPYYYSFGHDQASCSDSVTVGAQNQANTAVSKIVKNIEVVPQ